MKSFIITMGIDPSIFDTILAAGFDVEVFNTELIPWDIDICTRSGSAVLVRVSGIQLENSRTKIKVAFGMHLALYYASTN